MSFADIINQESKKLEEGNGGNDKVKYPETKHKALYFEKNQKEVLVQVLPSKDLVSMFAEPVRKIFLAAKSSNGKDINSNFTLDAEPNEGSLLEQKVQEWASKGMIPNGFGGQQSPRRLFLANVVNVIQFNGQWVQERDQQGNLVVRKFELPQSAFQNLLRKLADPLYNVSGTELSFMDINRPSPVKISKPAKGQMEYPVEAYSTIVLPPLGQGWENQLEDLKAQAVPTERLENGYQWVQAFVDMKEGRKPNRGGQDNATQQTAPAPQVNPYGNLGAQQPLAQPNPYAAAPAPQQPTMPNPYAATPAPQAQPNPYTAPSVMLSPYTAPAVMPNTYTAPAPTPAPQAQPPIDYNNIGEETDINTLMPTGMPQAPSTPATPAPTMPAHANSNGLNDIDSMLARELGNM